MKIVEKLNKPILSSVDCPNLQGGQIIPIGLTSCCYYYVNHMPISSISSVVVISIPEPVHPPRRLESNACHCCSSTLLWIR
jgi:hypothetical protein